MAQIRIPGGTGMEAKLSLVAVAIILTVPSASSMQCYKCTITPPQMLSNQTSRLCVDFDYSNKYIVDCPYSTMCKKQAFDLVLDNKKVHGVLRDCASQRYDYQVLEGGKWYPKSDIQEVYEEGCSVQDDKGARLPATEYCYCRGHLCNSAPGTHKGGDLNYHTDAMAVIMVFNAMKYIRSMR